MFNISPAFLSIKYLIFPFGPLSIGCRKKNKIKYKEELAVFHFTLNATESTEKKNRKILVEY
jgi:hypothetical protein